MPDHEIKEAPSLEEMKEVFLYQINQRKKHLDWFDYQVRGDRFDDKSSEELSEERKTILDEIKTLENKLSEVLPSD